MSNGILYQSSFSSGEIDPALADRTNLERYRSALRTAENVYIGRTGRVISRQGTTYWNKPKYPEQDSIHFIPKANDYMVEIGGGYIRVYNLMTGTFFDVVDVAFYSEADLPNIKIASNKDFIYIYCEGKDVIRFYLGNLVPTDPERATRYIVTPVFVPSYTQTGHVVNINTGTGYDVNYAASVIIDGEESLVKTLTLGLVPKLPVQYTERFDFTFTIEIPNASVNRIKHAYIYRRPANGNSYGFLATADVNTVGSAGSVVTPVTFKFVDFGQNADYTHVPPTYQADFESDVMLRHTGPGQIVRYQPTVGIIFQERHVTNGNTSLSRDQVFASRTTKTRNFYRDYPVDADSALAMKTSSVGRSRVLHFHDGGGLLAFTTGGIYSTPNGALVPQTAFFEKRSTLVIQEQVPPLEVPGAIFMMNATDDSLTGLINSQESLGLAGQDLSIYNNHMYFKRKVVSWSFQGGPIPLIWSVLSDGTAIAMSFNYQEQLRAFCRIETDGEFQQVMTHEKDDGTFDVYFTILRNGVKIIEKLADRYVDNLREYIGLDSTVIQDGSIFALTGGTTMSVTPLTPDDWDGTLVLSNTGFIFTNNPGEGAVGTVFRFFMSDDTTRDLTVTQFINATTVHVTSDIEFPPEESTNLHGYYTFKTINGLSHLEGKTVGVVRDGFIESSPLNTIENYQTYVVTGGAITLTGDTRAAIAYVGLPYACSIETLDVTTVEQKPVKPESKLLQSVNISLYNSRGLYVSDRLPKDWTNENMENTEQYEEDLVEPNLNGVLLQPYTREIEIGVAANWDSNGRIALRSVDPYPWELLSFISDLDIEYRSVGKGG